MAAKQTTSRGASGAGRRAQGWAALYGWHVDRDSAVPLFRQIYAQCRTAILAQLLPPDTRLPSTRALARMLGVARASVVAAYEQLLAEGYLCGKVGSGTYISADLPEPLQRHSARTTNRYGSHALPRRARDLAAIGERIIGHEERPFATARALLDARTLELWRKLSQRAIRSFDSIHRGYSDVRGLRELRLAICDYLGAARGVRAEPDNVVVTAGTQQGIDVATRVVLSPGDEVWVEDPGYPMTCSALENAGMRLRPVPVDQHGLDVSTGIRSAPKARAAVVTPSHQYPLGVVLSMARRLELLTWARETRGWIIEDDYHSEYRYAGRPLAALQGLDEAGRVIYVGTFNKVLFPGLRLGYVVVPPALVQSFIGARYLLDRQAPTLPQTIVAEFMQQGHFASHIRRMRIAYREQRDLLVEQLRRRLHPQLDVAPPDQGMHLVAYLREECSDVGLEAALRVQGVITRAVSTMYRKASPRRGLLLGFTGFPRQAIVPAVARMANVIASE